MKAGECEKVKTAVTCEVGVGGGCEGVRWAGHLTVMQEMNQDIVCHRISNSDFY